MSKALCLDVSYAAAGWVVVALADGIPEPPLAAGCITTKPSKREASKGADDIRRVAEIAKALRDIIRAHEPALIVAEMPYGSRSFTAAKALGICLGVYGCLREWGRVPCQFVTPYEARRVLCGNPRASKQAAQDAVATLWPAVMTWEGYDHCADALAALVGARDSDLYRMACGSNRGLRV